MLALGEAGRRVMGKICVIFATFFVSLELFQSMSCFFFLFLFKSRQKVMTSAESCTGPACSHESVYHNSPNGTT